MSRILREAFGRRISREQSRDTGMAMVLLMLIGSVVMVERNHTYRGEDLHKPY